ncbi:uncharacterized protein LODBEIA_P15820 [Lodderomyces beijingensis]|uniref:Sm protein B n=1 Tax=Lodderomyces beijingensis TaxID=1775926 RepID=A0ABP0ZGR1_9ASCO
MSIKLPFNKKTRMSDLINYRLKILTVDNRTYIGSLLSFDKHLNLVLSDTEETRITKKSWLDMKKRSEASDNKSAVSANNGLLLPENGPAANESQPSVTKRHLGLIILRGEKIISFSVETAPLTDVKTRVATGKGTSRPLKQPVSRLKKLA